MSVERVTNPLVVVRTEVNSDGAPQARGLFAGQTVPMVPVPDWLVDGDRSNR